LEKVEEGRGWRVRSTASYAPYVEYGSQPHNAPFSEIKRWVELVISPAEEDLDSVAWAVWNKIATEGIEPQPHVRPAIERLRSESQGGRARVEG